MRCTNEIYAGNERVMSQGKEKKRNLAGWPAEGRKSMNAKVKERNPSIIQPTEPATHPMRLQACQTKVANITQESVDVINIAKSQLTVRHTSLPAGNRGIVNIAISTTLVVAGGAHRSRTV